MGRPYDLAGKNMITKIARKPQPKGTTKSIDKQGFACKAGAKILLLAAMLASAAQGSSAPHETIGGGTVSSPAVGPRPDYGIGGPDMVLVKNWRFGKNGTIKDYADMNANFFYHDQFNTFCNGNGNYGSYIVSPDKANAIGAQPIEGVDGPPVREFTQDSLKTYLVPLHGATTVKPTDHNVGSGSFMAKWSLPSGGSLLGRDIVWETKVRTIIPILLGLRMAGNGYIMLTVAPGVALIHIHLCVSIMDGWLRMNCADELKTLARD